jgi:hypothetical protein
MADKPVVVGAAMQTDDRPEARSYGDTGLRGIQET